MGQLLPAGIGQQSLPRADQSERVSQIDWMPRSNVGGLRYGQVAGRFAGRGSAAKPRGFFNSPLGLYLADWLIRDFSLGRGV
jgi:hypothetical protein